MDAGQSTKRSTAARTGTSTTMHEEETKLGGRLHVNSEI